ncbi:MAG: carboxypeptidase regulatory-like domain-containing protein [Corynebacteriales bacterium]|nr:carboxypeptidase regulatory-like domain-containing protein [Mycobacteriales bacterium]
MSVAAALAAIIATQLTALTPLTPTPAPSQPNADLAIATESNIEFDDAHTRTLRYHITNNGPDDAEDVTSEFAAPYGAASASTENCSIENRDIICEHGDLVVGQRVDMSIELTGPPNADERNYEKNIRVSARTADPTTSNNEATYTASARTRSAKIREISGTVATSDGDPIPEARVTLTDAAGTKVEIDSDARGLFVYQLADAPTPLREGTVNITAQHKGFHDGTTDISTTGPILMGVSLQLKPTKAPTVTQAQEEVPQQTLTTQAQIRETERGPWLVVQVGSVLIVLGFVVAGMCLARQQTRHRPRHAR